MTPPKNRACARSGRIRFASPAAARSCAAESEPCVSKIRVVKVAERIVVADMNGFYDIACPFRDSRKGAEKAQYEPYAGGVFGTVRHDDCRSERDLGSLGDAAEAAILHLAVEAAVADGFFDELIAGKFEQFLD